MSNWSLFCHNFNVVPGGGGSEIPECNPYACDALATILTEEQFNYIVPTIADAGAWAYPFSTVDDSGGLGGSSNFNAWNFYVSGATLTNVFGGYIDKSNITGWSWFTEAEKLAFCSAASPAQAMDIETATTVNAITMPADSYIPLMGYSLNVIFTGFKGSNHAAIEMNGGSSAAVYDLYRNLGIYISTAQNVHYVNLIAKTPFVNYAIDITVGEGPGLANTQFDIGMVGGRWLNYTCSEEAWYELLDVGGGRIGIRTWSKVTATVTAKDGTTYTGSAQGYKQFSYAYDILSVVNAPSYNIYTCPRIFYGTTASPEITISHISFSESGTPDHDLISIGFQRQFTDYSLPGYCT